MTSSLWLADEMQFPASREPRITAVITCSHVKEGVSVCVKAAKLQMPTFTQERIEIDFLQVNVML